LIPKILLKPNRQKSVLRHHPWIFSGAIADVIGFPEKGETVRIHDSEDKFICWGAYSSSSQIAVRIWSWDEAEVIDEAFFGRRISKAIQMRKRMNIPSDALRLIYAESDGLPGIIVDQYVDFLVIQLLSAGAEYWKECIVNVCCEILGIKNIYERSDVDVRKLEGLTQRTGILRGSLPAENIIIQEHGMKYLIDIKRGHKTGFYLDQRDNRVKLMGISEGRDVLDCFSYTGAFSVAALTYGARSLIAIDSSDKALNIARENLLLNHLPDENVEFIEGDVFQELRTMRDRNRSFDLIIMDPPKFAPTKYSIQRASRGYKDINLLAFKLLRPGGYLVTFSCSGGIDLSFFQKIIADAAVDADANAVIIDRLHQACDHPVALNFPEGAYLKGYVIYKTE
jgi:23S rRNA (cytosine1962-C5)-methyltransferase